MSSKVSKNILMAGRDKDVPVIVPSSELTVKQIQDQIPAKYFVRSAGTSALYLARDLVQVMLTVLVMVKCAMPAIAVAESMLRASTLPPPAAAALGYALKFAVWNAFWFIQGLNWTAVWVVAHECGHQAFSPSRKLNNTVGMILHSALLVPFHSWRITHGNHHKHTNHLTKDTVFVPRKKNMVVDLVEETPIVLLGKMALMLLFGWPAYLLFNVASQDYGRRTNHFEPSSPLFRPEDEQDIILSDIGILAMLSFLGVCTYQFGILNMVCWYVMPYLWTNFWLVYITYMQHTDIRMPHYSHEEWTFVRGAIAAVDRDYGWLLSEWLHHINDSHVVHHIFSQMPHYNAITVTRKYIKEILGDTYIEDNMPLMKALYKSRTECRYVVPSEGISIFYAYKKRE